MVMSDVPNGRAIAKCYWVERDHTYTVNQRICALSPRGIDGKLLYYKLNRNSFYLAFDDGAKQTNLRKDDVLSCPLGIPKSGDEQRAITEALSDVDTLIRALDKLIAKKRDLKRAVVQQLLTGKQRLPGFSGDWEVKSLFQLADQKKEFFDDGDWIEAEFLTESGIRLVQTGNIGEGQFTDKESKKYISADSFKKLRCKELQIGDVLICRLAEPAGRACLLPDIGEARIITAVDVTIFRPLVSVADRRYLVNVFNTPEWFSSVSERCGGSTRTRIARGQLGKMEIKIPSLREQTAIADVLSDMDDEVSALEQRRDKTRDVKQGMMQELLSGKTRLI
jgi:type I restriction enzyme S subunit